jgi:predicted HicB family RNase H-like nuclease
VTLNVELNPKVTAGLLAQAEARRLSLEAYVSEVLKERSREA